MQDAPEARRKFSRTHIYSSYHESRRSLRDTYPESCITKYILVCKVFFYPGKDLPRTPSSHVQ